MLHPPIQQLPASGILILMFTTCSVPYVCIVAVTVATAAAPGYSWFPKGILLGHCCSSRLLVECRRIETNMG